MGTPTISILLPCLNAREFLEPRIGSLLNQTFADWEAIVLDSHSTDGSWEYFESVASADPRFQLHRVPRAGVYAALNEGLERATGAFLHIATCDDTMASEFLATMLAALEQCPEAGIAACDAMLINRHGQELTREDLAGWIGRRATRILLGAGIVRAPLLTKGELAPMNYRPPPHDCLMHFLGRSVYLSLNQLLVRMPQARAAGQFRTTIGTVADFGWLLRLTSLTGTLHVPEKLAMWRFHGDQLSMRWDGSRRPTMVSLCEHALPEIRERHRPLLTQDDAAALRLICRSRIARTAATRFWCRCRVYLRLLARGCFELTHPGLSLLRILLQRLGLAPREIHAPLKVNAASSRVS